MFLINYLYFKFHRRCTQYNHRRLLLDWIPAYAGMTVLGKLYVACFVQKSLNLKKIKNK